MSVITVLQVASTIGDGDGVLECPECRRTEGATLVARDALAVALCRCGGLWRHDAVTEDLVLETFRGGESGLAVVDDDTGAWPPDMLEDQPQLPWVADQLAALHATAPHARLVRLADRSLV